jgi:hypothetical protein
MWLIQQQKTRLRAGAAQQLSDCFQTDGCAGQFLSDHRDANSDQRVISASG